jgi:hypothetical protein
MKNQLNRGGVASFSLCAVILAAGLLMGIGANPRFIEEIAWGGGYGSTGGWLEADGDIFTNGNATVNNLTAAALLAAALSSTGDVTVSLDTDANGSNSLIIKDSTGATVATINEAGLGAFASLTASAGGTATNNTFPAWRGTRTTATTNSILGTLAVRLQLTSGSQADGFGPALVFEDTTGNGFAQIAGVRNGGDTTGALHLRPVTSGTAASEIILTGSGGTMGNASTDAFDFTGRIRPRTVTDSGMASTAGGAREALVFNSSDSRWYASIAGGSPATDWGYFLRSADATQVLSHNSGIGITLKDKDSTSATNTIDSRGTSGGNDTYGGAITFTPGGGVAIYQDPSPTNTSNNRARVALFGAGSALFTLGDNTAAGGEAHLELQRSSDSIPASMEVESADGTPLYLFAGNNGAARIHTAKPTADTDGTRLVSLKTLNVDTTAANTTSTTETTIRTYTVPADTLTTNGDRIEYQTVVKLEADDTDAATIRLKFGGQTIFTQQIVATGSPVSTDAVLHVTIIRTGAATQQITAWGNWGGAIVTSGSVTVTAGTQDLTTGLALAVTGEVDVTNGTANRVSYVSSTADVHYN